MIDFLPRYDDVSLDDAIKAAAFADAKTSNPDDVNLLTVTGEYIFLIDRSGSMDGERIKMAKEALINALKALPPNSFFNVFSFGSSYFPLSEKSTVSNETNIKSAIERVQSFEADMGGTEIYRAISDILNQPRKKNYPRTLFLLIDGEVSDPDQVISLIESNNHRARVFSLGIGSGCSTYLVGGCASAGRGKSEYVSDLKDISAKVISLMKAAFSPVCDDFTLEFTDKEAVSMIAPDPQSQSYLLREEKATFYIFLKNEAIKSSNENGEFIVTLKNFDTATGGYKESPIKLNLKEYETSLDLFKLGIGEAADILEKKGRNISNEVKENPDIFWAMKEDLNDELVKLSVENQVLTRRTAFVCVVKENSRDEIGSLKKEKTLIPQVLSSDYSEKSKVYGDSRMSLTNDKFANTTNSMYISSTIASPNVKSIIYGLSAILHSQILEDIDSGKELTPGSGFDEISEEKYIKEKPEEFDEQRKALLRETPTADNIYEFVKALYDCAQFSPECCIIYLVYINRLICTAGIPLHPTIWRPLILCSLLVAQKVWDGRSLLSSDFAFIYPLFSNSEVERLEQKFFELIQYNVFVKSALYAKYYFELRSVHANEGVFSLSPLDVATGQKLEERSGELKKKWTEARKQIIIADVPKESL